MKALQGSCVCMELLFSHALKLCLRKNKTKKLLKMIKIDFSAIILCSLNKNKNFQVLEAILFSKDPLFTVVAMPGLGGGGHGGGGGGRGGGRGGGVCNVCACFALICHSHLPG